MTQPSLLKVGQAIDKRPPKAYCLVRESCGKDLYDRYPGVTLTSKGGCEMKGKMVIQATIAALVLNLTASMAFAHCEIPCGIYDDEARIHGIEENILTIEKSMKEIMKLEKEKPINYNQLVRWIMNKEEHANKLQEIVSQYFLTQRIKIGTEKYEAKLSLLHKMLVYAMKSKQTTDLVHVDTLRSLLKEFRDLYFGQSN